MYRDWVELLCRYSVHYLDGNSICSKGEILEMISSRHRRRNAGTQEDDDWIVCFRPGRLPNAAGI